MLELRIGCMVLTFSSFETPLSAVVIGASGGLGAAFTAHLEGMEAVEKVFSFSRKDGFDLTDEPSIRSAADEVERGGGADLVIIATGLLHDAALQPEKSLRDFEAHNFQDVFAVNTTGPAMVMKHFLPLLPRDRKGVLAALSARVGSISDNQLGGWTAYRASKAALNMVIKNAAIETARRYKEGVIVGLHPGTVDTDLSAPFQSNVAEGKLFTPAYSAGEMLKVIDGLKPQDSGKVFDFNGEEVLP